MHKYDAIEKGIINRDIEGLREAVGGICYTNLDFSNGEFDEAISYVESKGIIIKEDTLVGKLVSVDKNTFTDDDFAMAVLELKENFCNERIADVKKIGRSLYGKAKYEANKTKVKPRHSGTIPNMDSYQSKGKKGVILKKFKNKWLSKQSQNGGAIWKQNLKK